MAENRSVHVMIKGRVQGVWFRGWTIEQARHRQLAGWVRNRADGSVEAVFSGPSGEVDAMVAACRHGPPGAYVDEVLSEPAATPNGRSFRQLPTM